MTVELDKIKPLITRHFERGSLPQYDRTLSRDSVGRQLMKVCYSCGKGFCKKKNRAKAGPVANAPGRYVCQRCVNALLAGKGTGKVQVLSR